MKINLEYLDKNNNVIPTPKPIWLEHLIYEQGTKRIFKFTFTTPISILIQKIKIQINDEPFQLFIVDKFEQNYQNKKKFFTLTASNPLSLITQNNPPPQRWENFSTQTLIEQFCKPFKIKNIQKKLQTDSAIPFYTTLGMTNWDVIKLFFRKQFNCCVYVDENNTITSKFIPNKQINFNSTDPTLTQIEQIEDRAKLFSTIIVQKYDDDPNMFSVLNIKNSSITQNNINRVKFYKVPPQYELMPNRGAQTIFDRINADHKILKLKFKKNIKPIYPGSIIKFTNNNITQTMCVNSFKTSINKEGSFSEITMAYADLVI